MLRALLLSLVAGLRSMTPLAAVAIAGRSGRLPRHNGAPSILSHHAVAMGAAALAVGELLGDKMRSAPDRIIAPGLAARVATGSLAAAALSPKRQRPLAMALGAGAAVAAAYVGFGARVRAMRRFGQVRTGLVEDAIAVGAALWLVGGVQKRSPTSSSLRAHRATARSGSTA